MNIYPEEIDMLYMSYAQISFKAEVYAESIEVNWGDGTISTYRNHFSVLEHNFTNEGLQTIQIKGNAIDGLKIPRLSLTSLTFKHCLHLKYLDCSINELNLLDLSHCLTLEELYCNSNNIAKLDLPHQPHLQQANLSYNLLKSLDISACTELQFLHCNENRLSHLRLNSRIPLQYLDISNNLLEWEALEEIFQQQPHPENNKIIHYAQNPGTDFYNHKILTSRKF